MHAANPTRTPIQFPPELLDPDALKVIRRLRQFNYEAYLVGGCVRDLLLGERPKDFDVATSARPQEIKKLFRNCRIIGRRFRLAHILFANRKVIDVATFRAAGMEEAAPVSEDREGVPIAEGEAAVNENPVEAAANEEGTYAALPPMEEPRDLLIRDDNVFGTAETDALRRDFTLNSLFYDTEAQEVIDYTDGLKHLEERRLVAIGDPMTRLREDPVRIIRAAKFAARLGLRPEENLWEAMKVCHAEIARSSSSRILEEIYKILAQKGAGETFALLQELGIVRYILPFLAEDYELSAKGQAYWDYLHALERGVAGRIPEGVAQSPPALYKPTRAILFSALIAPLLEKDFAANTERVNFHVLREELHRRIQGFAMAMRNARKDTFRAEQAFLAQDRLAKGARQESAGESVPHRRRRRGLSPRKFAERAYFSEALQLFWLRACVTKDAALWEAYETWSPWLNTLPGELEGGFPRRGGAAPGEPRREDHPQRHRKRRRRRRWREHLKAI